MMSSRLNAGAMAVPAAAVAADVVDFGYAAPMPPPYVGFDPAGMGGERQLFQHGGACHGLYDGGLDFCRRARSRKRPLLELACRAAICCSPWRRPPPPPPRRRRCRCR